MLGHDENASFFKEFNELPLEIKELILCKTTNLNDFTNLKQTSKEFSNLAREHFKELFQAVLNKNPEKIFSAKITIEDKSWIKTFTSHYQKKYIEIPLAEFFIRTRQLDLFKILYEAYKRLHFDMLEENAAKNIATQFLSEQLGHAIIPPYPEAVNYLLQEGANANAEYEGYSVLSCAVYIGNLEICKALVQHSAEITEHNYNKSTSTYEGPLLFALAYNRKDIANFFIESIGSTLLENPAIFSWIKEQFCTYKYSQNIFARANFSRYCAFIFEHTTDRLFRSETEKLLETTRQFFHRQKNYLEKFEAYLKYFKAQPENDLLSLRIHFLSLLCTTTKLFPHTTPQKILKDILESDAKFMENLQLDLIASPPKKFRLFSNSSSFSDENLRKLLNEYTVSTIFQKDTKSLNKLEL